MIPGAGIHVFSPAGGEFLKQGLRIASAGQQQLLGFDGLARFDENMIRVTAEFQLRHSGLGQFDREAAHHPAGGDESGQQYAAGRPVVQQPDVFAGEAVRLGRIIVMNRVRNRRRQIIGIAEVVFLPVTDALGRCDHRPAFEENPVFPAGE